MYMRACIARGLSITQEAAATAPPGAAAAAGPATAATAAAAAAAAVPPGNQPFGALLTTFSLCCLFRFCTPHLKGKQYDKTISAKNLMSVLFVQEDHSNEGGSGFSAWYFVVKTKLVVAN